MKTRRALVLLALGAAHCAAPASPPDARTPDASAPTDVARSDAPADTPLDTPLPPSDDGPTPDVPTARDVPELPMDAVSPTDVFAPRDAPADAPRSDTPPSAVTYTTETRTLTSGTATRTFIAATPAPLPASPALVIALHGDGGDGAGLRRTYPLEAASGGAAVVLYPNAPGRTFEYYTYEGRTRETQFVRELIDDAVARYHADRARVFLTGFSGGSTMANALNCRLGATVLRGVGINSGTLYPTTSTSTPMRPDFAYTANGGVDCADGLAPTLFVWGQNDTTEGVRFSYGEDTRDNYLATQACRSTTEPFAPSPCVRYQGCTRDVVWCAIPGMAHALWPQAAAAAWSFFAAAP